MKLRYLSACVGLLGFTQIGTTQTEWGIFGGLAGEQAELTGLSVRPGLYDVTITQFVSGFVNGERKETPPETQSGQLCLNPDGQEVSAEDFNKPGCEVVTHEIDDIAVYFAMSCKADGKEMSGRWKIQSGDSKNMLKTGERFRLDDGRMATQQFFVSGKLSHNDAAMTMNVTQQFNYAGECSG